MTMRSLSGLLFAAILVPADFSCAGDGEPPRKHFKESLLYPFTFRPECYLAGPGPLPLRFAAEKPACGDRNPPPLTGEAKSGPKKEAPAVETKPADTQAPSAAFPPPAEAQPPKRDNHDFSRVPDEVLDFFKNTEGRPLRRDYLFDPIFQPALPHELPKSKATIQQK
jgi:hypothetical protein